jgi:hypothetical protein
MGRAADATFRLLDEIFKNVAKSKIVGRFSTKAVMVLAKLFRIAGFLCSSNRIWRLEISARQFDHWRLAERRVADQSEGQGKRRQKSLTNDKPR